MKRITVIYTLTTKNGSRISVTANNRVEAFKKMSFMFPTETEGCSFCNITEKVR